MGLLFKIHYKNYYFSEEDYNYYLSIFYEDNNFRTKNYVLLFSYKSDIDNLIYRKFDGYAEYEIFLKESENYINVIDSFQINNNIINKNMVQIE